MRRRDDERRGRIIHQYRALPGSPQAAWCWPCHTEDPIVEELMVSREDGLPGRPNPKPGPVLQGC